MLMNLNYNETTSFSSSVGVYLDYFCNYGVYYGYIFTYTGYCRTQESCGSYTQVLASQKTVRSVKVV